MIPRSPFRPHLHACPSFVSSFEYADNLCSFDRPRLHEVGGWLICYILQPQAQLCHLYFAQNMQKTYPNE